MTKEEKKILSQIKKNNPNLDVEYTATLAKTIVQTSKKYGIHPKVLAAMLMQESAYKISAKNIKCGISIENGKKDCIIVDFGIGQINHKTIKAFKFDRNKLLTDLSYSIEASAKVLADFKRMYGHKESDYWSRYNASTPSKRLVYKRLVARYM